MDMVFLKKMEKNGRVKKFEHTWRILQKKPKATAAFGFFKSGVDGIRTHAPGTDDRISSAARYDLFDTTPKIRKLYVCTASLYYHR